MTTLVYVDTTRNYYARYDGRQCTRAVQSDTPLTQSHVESFRRDPRELLGDFTPSEPEAA